MTQMKLHMFEDIRILGSNLGQGVLSASDCLRGLLTPIALKW